MKIFYYKNLIMKSKYEIILFDMSCRLDNLIIRDFITIKLY